MNDDLRLHDMNPNHAEFAKKHASFLNFPFRCGMGWRAEETHQFMELLNLGPGSPIYEQVEGITGTRHQNELFYDRIPRVGNSFYTSLKVSILTNIQEIAELENITAISSCLNYCSMSIRLPEKKDEKGDSSLINQWRVHNEPDEDCVMIIEGTRGMEELEANTAFCENRLGHTVFDRQKDHYTLPETLKDVPSHQKMCQNWLKDQKKASEKERKEQEKNDKEASKKNKAEKKKEEKEKSDSKDHNADTEGANTSGEESPTKGEDGYKLPVEDCGWKLGETC